MNWGKSNWVIVAKKLQKRKMIDSVSINDRWQVWFKQEKYDISVLQLITIAIATVVNMGSIIHNNYFYNIMANYMIVL